MPKLSSARRPAIHLMLLAGAIVTSSLVACSDAINDGSSPSSRGGATATSGRPSGGASINSGATVGGSPSAGGKAFGGTSTAHNPSSGGSSINNATTSGGSPGAGGKAFGGTSTAHNPPSGGAKTNGGTTSAGVSSFGGTSSGGAATLGGGRAGSNAAGSGALNTGGHSIAGASATAGIGSAAGANGLITGSIVPLYSDPSEAPWAAIIAAKRAHPSVPVIAILDPADGPGAAQDEAYIAGISSLKDVGILTIGYVYTSYGARAASTVRSDIEQWHAWYPSLDGIFFDEAANTADGEGYYRDLAAQVKSLGMSLTVANPGTDTTAAYIAAVDVSFVYENSGLPATSMLATWKTRYPRSAVGVIPYASSLDAAWVRAARASVGYIYVTNDDLPNPWDTLPGFFGDLLGLLE